MRNTLNAYLRERYAASARYAEQLTISLGAFERWAGRPIAAAEMSNALMLDFLRDYSRNHAAATVNSKRRALLTIWRCAARNDGTVNPPGPIPAVPEPRRVPTAWSVAEIEGLIAAARSLPGRVGDIPRRHWWPALFLVVYDSAARIGSVLSARTEDCDLGERSLLLRAEDSKTNTDQLFWLHDQTISAIAPIWCPHQERLFPWPHHRRTLFSQCRAIVEAAGLRTTTRGMGLFHKIRRTNLSYCAASSIALAQRQAGHSDSRTTVRHYIDPRITRTQSAVDVLPRPTIADEQRRLF